VKIVLDARYVRERPSGIGAYVRSLVDRLPALAPEAQFEFWAHRLAERPLSTAPNVRERTVDAEPNSLGTVFWPTRLAPLADAGLFHAPHNILGRGIRCPTVVTVHDVMWLLEPRLLPWGTRLPKQLFTPAAIRHGLRRATRIITVSNASADAIRRVAPSCSARLRVIPQGFDTSFAAPLDEAGSRAQAERLLGTGAAYLLVIGQNSPSKGHRVALEAFAAVARRDLRLVLVQRRLPGRGLHSLASRLGVLDRVHWLPLLPPADVVTLVQSAMALLQPSLAEGFGLPALEAMASGCPVVASDIPALRELLGGAGVLVAPGDSRALAAAIRRLVEEPGLRGELRERGLARARDFSWDRNARATLEVYREAADLSRRPDPPVTPTSVRLAAG
jgi:glycosyltransferase involved in cell wall biosynthesis